VFRLFDVLERLPIQAVWIAKALPQRLEQGVGTRRELRLSRRLQDLGNAIERLACRSVELPRRVHELTTQRQAEGDQLAGVAQVAPSSRAGAICTAVEPVPTSFTPRP
jgi:hypothetical protein